jgi:hypothetical protein
MFSMWFKCLNVVLVPHMLGLGWGLVLWEGLEMCFFLLKNRVGVLLEVGQERPESGNYF